MNYLNLINGGNIGKAVAGMSTLNSTGMMIIVQCEKLNYIPVNKAVLNLTIIVPKDPLLLLEKNLNKLL